MRERLPFQEIVKSESRVRTFSKDVNLDDLKWHTDEQDRIVIPINETNWQLQIDNQLPERLIKNKEYFIPEGVYHRVIKGDGDLKVQIFFK